MSLRQDSDPYCLLLLGLVVLTSYLFNYFYVAISYPISWILIGSYFIFVAGLPLLMVFFLIGYFRPEKGKAKNTAMSISIVIAFFYVVFTYAFADSLYNVLSMASDNTGFYYSVWGLGGSILTAAGFSIMHTKEESTSPGILDTSALRYGPEPEPEPEEAIEDEEAPPIQESSAEETKPETDEPSATTEPQSE
ncbi:hypothetical protein E4H12_00015 [Candidatus Thorarchaeota archaeon]|nr:hypothetical protein [Candidatus Thorarchaeota archaeon]TFH00136.1 MAG: hypothetical protein E4H12_00015 [Candidatus Thorarchaeota archaeon]